jgi:hypothetical protein
MSKGFQPYEPRDLGHYTDMEPKAETRAISAVEVYIKALEQKAAMLEQLRDGMALLILELVKALREREDDDLGLLMRLREIEEMVGKM